MDAAETDHNKNRTPSRKSSAIPRLHNKQNIFDASIPEKIEENAVNHPDGSPEKNRESRESCFCTSCYNKTKNLFKFTLNGNLVRNLPNEKDEAEVTSYNETEDDDVNSAIIMTDGGSPRSEVNCLNQIRKQENDKFGQTSLIIKETTSSKPNPPRSKNYDKYQNNEYLPDTTIPTKEAKRITKELRKISSGSNHAKLRIRNDKSQKHPVSSERNNCAPVKVSSTKHADNIKSCLLKVKTRNHLKYTLTNVTNRHPHSSKKERASFSKESSASSSRCVTPTEINLQKTQENVLNVSKLLDESNLKNFENYSIQNQTNLFNAPSNSDNYPCQPDNNPLSHLFRTGNPWENNVSDVHADQPKNSEYANQSTLEALPNTPKEIKRDCLMNALLEVFGGDSHITQKLRNSTITKCDSRFRNIRSAKSYNLNFDSNVVENKMKTYTCHNSPSIESNLCKKDELQSDICKSDHFSSCTFSSLEKSLPETFSSAQMDFPKTSRNNYNQLENYISLKRCKCQNLKCHQLDELNESIMSMQTEIKTLIKSLPCGVRCTCTISDEIIKLKQFYRECQQNELKRNLQQKKLEYDIKEIYRRIDKLIEPKRNSFCFKYFVMLPLIGILAMFSVSCLGELKKN